MEDLLPASNGDAVRELLIIIVGLIVRAIEKRQLKKQLNAQPKD